MNQLLLIHKPELYAVATIRKAIVYKSINDAAFLRGYIIQAFDKKEPNELFQHLTFSEEHGWRTNHEMCDVYETKRKAEFILETIKMELKTLKQ